MNTKHLLSILFFVLLQHMTLCTFQVKYSLTSQPFVLVVPKTISKSRKQSDTLGLIHPNNLQDHVPCVVHVNSVWIIHFQIIYVLIMLYAVCWIKLYNLYKSFIYFNCTHEFCENFVSHSFQINDLKESESKRNAWIKINKTSHLIRTKEM